MIRRRGGMPAVVTLAVAAGTIVAGARAETDLNASWSHGIRLEAPDGSVKLRLGGRIMSDWVWMNESPSLRAAFGTQPDGHEFRRARLYVSGEMDARVIFKAQYDFAGQDVDFKDVYVGIKHLPYAGTLKVGHFKEPFSLEELTSSRFLTFLERSLPNAFVPGRNSGAGLANGLLGNRLTWALGAFRDVGDGGSGTGSGGAGAVSARITGLPWFGEEGARLVHLGASYTRRSPPGHSLRFRQRPEVHTAGRYADTGPLTRAGSVDIVGGEAALVRGPFSIQGEAMAAYAVLGGASDPVFTGAYAQASAFLTGEHRAFSPGKAAFGRVKPARSFSGPERGPGAWELAVRFSRLDLEDAGVRGRVMTDLTVGVNWHLNANARVMTNFVHAIAEEAGRGSATANAFLARAQVDF